MQKLKSKPTLLSRFLEPPVPKKGRMVTAFEQIFGLKEGWYKHRDFGRNNFDLGMQQFQKAEFSDAVFRFKLVTWKEPERAEAWYMLGRSLIRDGKKEEAVEPLKKAQSLKYNPEDVRYMMALALGKSAPAEALPTRIPQALVKERFADASTYTVSVNAARHKGHAVVADAARAAAQQGRIDHVVLDLGVGTGLCGVLLRDIASHITGVDISTKMLEQAMLLKDNNGRKLYDALIHREAEDFLNASADASFDIVLAAGLVDYIGNLDAMWQQIGRVLKPGGFLALTASIAKEGGCRFDPDTEYFRFTDTYLKGLASRNGMAVVKLEEVSVSNDQVMWLGVFKK